MASGYWAVFAVSTSAVSYVRRNVCTSAVCRNVCTSAVCYLTAEW